jgi:hypothetical protein
MGVGAQLAPKLAEHFDEVYGFQAGGKAIDTEQYENAKSEVYWLFREYLQDGLVSGLEDEDTIAQLSPIEYKLTPRGKTMIEPKEVTRERMGTEWSPDRAEALILAFATITPRHQYLRYGEHWGGYSD